jgi:protein phosphatase
MSDLEEDTIDWAIQKTFADYFFAPHQPRFEVDLAAATHPGKVRSNNEDHYAITRRTRSCEILLTNLQRDDLTFPDDHAYCLVVADGIGGAAFGEVASDLALNTMLELAGRATSWVMKFTDLDAQDLRQRVDAYVEQIQKRFRACSQDDPRLRGMGTTLTCACLLPPHAVFVHIGDSRAYLYRGGQLKQITRDQTLAQDMIDLGAAPDDVRTFGNLLTGSLSGDTGQAMANVIHVELEAGDRLLLCTDGLSDMADDTTIAGILETVELQPACDQLVQVALERGGKDNITVVLCDLLAAGND